MLKLFTIVYPVILIVLFTIIHRSKKCISILYYMVFYGIMTGMIALNQVVGKNDMSNLGDSIIHNTYYLIYGVDLIATLIFFLSIQSSRYIHKSYEDQFGSYQDKILKMQMEEVEGIYLTMRGWRHDYHNHMQKIKAHIALNQIEEVKKYLDYLEEDLNTIDVKYKTGNVSLDAILNSKLSVAEKLKIDINCKAMVTEELFISDIDLCVVIGNLIDNAMEACEQMKEVDEKFLRIYICIRKQQLYISVTNSTSEVIRKLDKEYISQKRGNHGHGLKRIDLIVEKHGGFIKRTNEPGVFATEIMLPL